MDRNERLSLKFCLEADIARANKDLKTDPNKTIVVSLAIYKQLAEIALPILEDPTNDR